MKKKELEQSAVNQQHPVSSLPFVRDKHKGEGPGRCFWDPKGTGDYHKDITLGEEYAAAALEHISLHSDSSILGHIVFSMIENKEACPGVIVGFFGKITCEMYPHINNKMAAAKLLMQQHEVKKAA